MPVGGPEWDASFAAEGVVTVGIDDRIRRCGRWFGGEGSQAVAAVVCDGRCRKRCLVVIADASSFPARSWYNRC